MENRSASFLCEGRVNYTKGFSELAILVIVFNWPKLSSRDILNKSPAFWKTSMETLQEHLIIYCHVIKTH